MKDLVKILFSLIIIYFILVFIIHISKKGFELEYKFDEVTVKEKFVKKENKYYLNINYNNTSFYYEMPNNFKKKKKIINNIKVYSDSEYTCIYPIFSNYKLDITCKKDNINFNYHDLYGTNGNLDNFVKSLKKYDIKNFQDSIDFKKKDNIYIYENNIVDNHYLGISNYKGLYLINKKDNLKNISLFINDVYDNKNSTFFDKYYLSANYNSEYDFDEFYLIDLENGNRKTIKSYDNDLSFDLVLQGYVDGYYYIFDKNSLNQYKNNDNSISLVSNKNIKYYDNGKWNTEYYTKLESLIFNTSKTSSDDKYTRIDEVNDYYYYFKKVNNTYDVYRSYKNKKDDLIYLFTTSEIKNVIYIDNYVYYLDDTTIRYYNDLTGVRSVFANKEFSFNDTLKFGVYKKGN